MSDSESDIEIKSALPKMEKKKAKIQSSSEDPTNKKITTKMMITTALIELKTRKGVSLYAIKKYLNEKYNVNTEKLNYLIKKSIKAGVEDGSFVQMKGIGASGSFKLANVKTKPKPKKKQESSKKNSEKTEKEMEDSKTDSKPSKVKKPKRMEIKKLSEKTDEKKEKGNEKLKKNDRDRENMTEKPKKPKGKTAKGMQTPAKKRAAMMKRKSIGSIIKPPKMKPKLQASK